MNESVIIQKLIQVGQMLELGEIEYSSAEADIKHYLEQYAALRQNDVMAMLPDGILWNKAKEYALHFAKPQNFINGTEHQ